MRVVVPLLALLLVVLAVGCAVMAAVDGPRWFAALGGVLVLGVAVWAWARFRSLVARD
ncbi:hypothetical protein [Aquipuribacter hungaricus]|uniref:Uncharacterized protein n=1 Tax=Aquipuribacter hungaricus TaxID=545624 RepID=A0ABV7WL10_9MICO